MQFTNSWTSFKSNILICLSASWKSIFAAPYYFVITAVKLSVASSYPLKLGLNLISVLSVLADKIKVERIFPAGKANFSAISHLSSVRCVRGR